MHGYTLWMATRADWDRWAQVVDDHRQLRPATTQELLNRGVAVLDQDAETVMFSVGRVEWKPGDFPGSVVSAGPERHQQLPARLRDRVERERVGREDGGKVRSLEVRSADVRHTDVRDGGRVPPFRWAGEP